jgi:hypothetical protein
MSMYAEGRGASSDWIGVGTVAAEMQLPEKVVWEMLRKLGVPILPPGARLKTARFRRAEFERLRDQGARPLPPRATRSRPATEPPPVAADRRAAALEAKRARLRGLKP